MRLPITASTVTISEGFLSGLYAANYDITHIFIDSALKIINQPVDHKTEDFLDWCESFSEREDIKFTITISADATLATDGIKKYLALVLHVKGAIGSAMALFVVPNDIFFSMRHDMVNQFLYAILYHIIIWHIWQSQHRERI